MAPKTAGKRCKQAEKSFILFLLYEVFVIAGARRLRPTNCFMHIGGARLVKRFDTFPGDRGATELTR